MKTNNVANHLESNHSHDLVVVASPRHTAIRKYSVLLIIVAGMQTLGLSSSQAATTKKQVTDASITSAVNDGLIFDKGRFPVDVDVNTQDGIVTLSGPVDNLFAKERAVYIAESIRGVRGVIDRITVAPISRADEDIRKDMLTALQQDPATESYQVAVSVKDGIATLKGTLGSYAEKQLAERIAKGIKGAKEVRDEVGINYLAKRTDQEIAADVIARLQWDIWINGDSVNATVKDGKVILTGTAGSAIGKSRAVDDAWVTGVMSVDENGLKVESWANNDARKKFADTFRSSDDIKKAVQAALHFDPRVSAFSLEVTVEDGVVILGGNVGNLKAKNAAEQDAKNIVGVAQVDDLLKVRLKGPFTDGDMEKQLKAALKWNALLDSSNIDVAVINHVAYLSGTADSNFEKSEAQNTASRIKGIRLVRNHLKVETEFPALYYDQASYYDWPYYYTSDVPYYRGGSSYVALEEIGPQPYLSDEKIKKKIKDSFFWSPFVDSDDVDVVVHGGVATLSGTLGTWIGWSEADKDARKSGAGDVINHIKVK